MNIQVYQEWRKFFQTLSIHVTFDIETLAIFRGLFVNRPQNTTAVVDLGSTVTNLAVFSPPSGGLSSTYSIPVAGQTLTDQIAQKLNLPPQEAENLKISTGLSDSQHPVHAVLVSSLQPLVNELQKGLQFYHDKYDQAVDQVVLAGGTSQLPGLVEYLQQQLKTPVSLGQIPWFNNQTGLTYVEAVGLALRGFDRPQDENDPLLQEKAGSGSQAKLGQNITQVLSQSDQNSNNLKDKLTDEVPKATILVTPQERQQFKKLHQNKKVLLSVLATGLLAILTATWYR